MSELPAALEAYVSLRRSLGFVLKEADFLLPSFVAFAQARETPYLTTELALEWANSHPGVLAVTKRQRLSAVRGFATYLKTIDDRTEIPPPDLLPATYRRVTPHIYTDEEIDALLAAAGQLTPPIRARTYETLIGLLAVSGIRIGEAIRLDRTDIDHARSVLVVRNSKLEKARQVPLHLSTLKALVDYQRERDLHFNDLAGNSFFVSTLGSRLHPRTVGQVWKHPGRVYMTSDTPWPSTFSWNGMRLASTLTRPYRSCPRCSAISILRRDRKPSLLDTGVRAAWPSSGSAEGVVRRRCP